MDGHLNNFDGIEEQSYFYLRAIIDAMTFYCCLEIDAC